jgi:hypothetical protein
VAAVFVSVAGAALILVPVRRPRGGGTIMARLIVAMSVAR